MLIKILTYRAWERGLLFQTNNHGYDNACDNRIPYRGDPSSTVSIRTHGDISCLQKASIGKNSPKLLTILQENAKWHTCVSWWKSCFFHQFCNACVENRDRFPWRNSSLMRRSTVRAESLNQIWQPWRNGADGGPGVAWYTGWLHCN